MKTQFQKRLLHDTNTLWAIVKTYHPDIPDEGKEKLSAYLKYDWVCIYFRVNNYGTVSIGINNACNYSLYGPAVSKNDIVKALQNGKVTFRTWRFSLDKLFSKKILRSAEYEALQKSLDNAAIAILKATGYKLQSPEEMYRIYYED